MKRDFRSRLFLALLVTSGTLLALASLAWFVFAILLPGAGGGGVAWTQGLAASLLVLTLGLGVAYVLAHSISARLTAPLRETRLRLQHSLAGRNYAADLARQNDDLLVLDEAMVRMLSELKDSDLAMQRELVDAETGLAKRAWELESTVATLARAKQNADAASRSKSEFLQTLSHELRTSLNAMLGFAQLLEESARDREQAEYAGEILAAGRQLLEFINELQDMEVLELSCIEAGRLGASHEPVALKPLIDECLDEVQPLAEARGIRLVDGGESGNRYAIADRMRLKQLLLMLLSNAVKQNRERGTVTVVCVATDGRVEVRVSDTGPGLTEEERLQVFEGGGTSGEEGNGADLALSKRLAQLTKAEIGVTGTQGVGSTFWVRLQEHTGATGDPGGGPAGTGPRRRAADKGNCSLLCIEDNPANLRLIQRIIDRRGGIHLLSASSGAAGLELAFAHLPSLILLDINLPDMDGFEVLERLRARPETGDIPVVAISANAMPEDIERGKAAGFADYLTKPFELARFLTAVDSYCGCRD